MRQIFFIALFFSTLFRCDIAASQSTSSDLLRPAPAGRPLDRLPYTPSLDVSAMDQSANACIDFYQYASGGWMTHNPIPSDQASWSVYGKLYQDNQQFLWGIVDKLGKVTAH